MSLLEIIQLIGYCTGAALPLWLSVLLARQRRTLAPQERVLLALAISIGLWHGSNLLIVLRGLLGLDAARWVLLLRFADTVAVASITLAYSFLLHVHLHLWANAHDRALTRFERVRVWLSYVPALFLFVAVPRLWTGAYAPMLEKLSFFVLPFGLWATYVLCLIAATDILIARAARTQGERRLMRTLAGSFLIIAALLLMVYALGVGRGGVLKDYLQTLGNLGSLLPTALIAYHVYRYRYLELIIKESLVAATFAGVILVVYLYGIRKIETWVTARYGLRAGAVEALLILAFALSAAPLRAWLEKRFQQLFAREAALYREVVARIGTQARSHQQLPELLRFVEERTAKELALRRVRFYVRAHHPAPSDNAEGNAPAFLSEHVPAFSSELNEGQNGQHNADATPGEAGKSAAWYERVLALARAEAGVLEGAQELRERGFEMAYALRREEQEVGLMLVDAARAALTTDVRAVLAVLAGQVAIAVEDARLVEENVLLERKLAHGERLAALGQMAAAVAHEVKNPLSAIKSIAQVMREDENVKREYERDLSLIVGETDRLSRSVTQLLSFARTSPSSVAPSHAAELVRAVVELFRAEASGRNIKIECRAQIEGDLDGPAASALRDALSNLLINAIQATPLGGHISVESEIKDNHLLVTVTDSGPGIAPDLRERIWEPFFTTKQRGTGLGLAIVRKRMEEAGGSARLVNTQAGQGARFELRVLMRGA
jgi:signal transduction histidine kinase